MKHYQINIKSKSKKCLKNFLTFFLKNLKNYNIINKQFKKNKKRKILTVLKSPHVNKKAQEQFQSNSYSININLYLTQNSIVLLFIKKISVTIFLNVQIQIKFSLNHNLTKTAHKKILNPTNFKLHLLNKKVFCNEIARQKTKNVLLELKKKELRKVSKLLQILDIYGEFSNKTNMILKSKV